jgi:CubicO group peptidase (beta-lactamase class C family)
VLPGALRLRDTNGAAITFADLATHRSGLPRLPSNLRRPDGEDPYDYASKELWDFLADWKPTTARQTRWEYSNLGYGLLGEALALRHRSTFAELLSTRILAPLGLDHMKLALRDTTVPNLAPGHDAQGRPAALWRFGAMAAAGALAGSARDLARYDQAALGAFDHPLKAAFALAFTVRTEGPSAMNPAALAWLSAPLMKRRVLTHDGGTAGYSASLFVDPTNRSASFVLSNTAMPVQDLAIHFLEPQVAVRDLRAERRQTEQRSVAVSPQAMAELAGTYALQPQFKVTVRVRDGRLFAQATGQGEFELFAAEDRRWFARVTALEVHFEGAEGPSQAFVLHQGGQRLRFVRE